MGVDDMLMQNDTDSSVLLLILGVEARELRRKRRSILRGLRRMLRIGGK
jgi:hypothetical protein